MDPYGDAAAQNTSRENINSDYNMEGGQHEKYALKPTMTLRSNNDEPETIVDNHKKNPDPFLFAGSMIMTGSGKAVICAVGKNTRVSRNRQLGDLLIKND